MANFLDGANAFASPGENMGNFNTQAGKNKQPPMPDYIGAANAQSFGSIGTALANNLMSHPNVSTPLGKQTWTQSGSTPLNIPGLGTINLPQYSQSIEMSPEQQSLYNRQTNLGGGLLDVASNNLTKSPDLNSVQDVADKAYGGLTSRLDPQWKQNEQANDSQLANQGIMRGSEAYDNSKRSFNNAKNDAYNQASLTALQTMPQTFQLGQQIRDLPLNEMNALKSGSQVNMPQFQASQYPGQATGPNTLGATQAQAGWQQGMYNQQVAQQNANMQGLMGLGSAAMMAFA